MLNAIVDRISVTKADSLVQDDLITSFFKWKCHYFKAAMLSVNFRHVMWQQVGLISSVTMGLVSPHFFFFILGLNKTNKKILSSCAQIAADGAGSLCLPQQDRKHTGDRNASIWYDRSSSLLHHGFCKSLVTGLGQPPHNHLRGCYALVIWKSRGKHKKIFELMSLVIIWFEQNSLIYIFVREMILSAYMLTSHVSALNIDL